MAQKERKELARRPSGDLRTAGAGGVLQPVARREGKSRPWMRPALLAAAGVLAALVVTLWLTLPKPPADTGPLEPKNGVLAAYTADEVQTLSVALTGGAHWTAVQDADGLHVTDQDGLTFTADRAMANAVLTAASVIGYNEILAEDWHALREEPAAFGLDEPRLTVSVTYLDGTACAIRVGSRSPSTENNFYYMTADGDSRLFAIDIGTVEDLSLPAGLLRAVPKTGILAALVDEVTIEDAGGTRAWALDGEVTDSDAADRWFLMQPFAYPADGETLDHLRTNLTNLTLSAWVADARAADLAAYGLDEPAAVLTVHQAAGTTMSTGTGGASTAVDHPEQTVILTVGGQRSEMVSYVRLGDDICTMSTFLLQAVTGVQPEDSVTRFPVLTALANLSSLTVEQEGRRVKWTVERTERVAANNELVTDENGSVVYDTSVTADDGTEMTWEMFEARYTEMLQVTVSGTLPADSLPEAEPHTVYTFETVTGTEHTIALTAWDALHDAVSVDGCTLFYLVKGGLSKGLEPAAE